MIVLRIIDPIGVNQIPSVVQFCGGQFALFGHAGPGYASIEIEPMLFMIGCDVAHRAAHRILDPGLPLETLVHFQETVVDGFVARSEHDLDYTKAGIDRIEEVAVP